MNKLWVVERKWKNEGWVPVKVEYEEVIAKNKLKDLKKNMQSSYEFRIMVYVPVSK